MTTSDEKLNKESNQETVNDVQENNEQAPLENGQALVDGSEVTVSSATPAPPVEVDPLEGFSPDNFKDGVEGDERYRILDLFLGYLAGQKAYYDPIAIRHPLVKWDTSNRPPLGIIKIHAHIGQNYAKWLRHHYLYRTGSWAGVKVR